MKEALQIFTFSILKTFTGKTFISFCLLLFAQQMFGQVADNFSDGDFTSNPAWYGSTAAFTATGNNLRTQQQSADGSPYLSTPSAAMLDATWEFTVTMEFNPSSTSYARVYVSASQPSLDQPLDGYFVMIGNSADEISLYRQTGNTRTRIIAGAAGRVNAPAVQVRVKVTRDAAGHWQLFSDATLSGSYTLEGQTDDTTHPASRHFGVQCVYPAARSDKFSFDDFVVTGQPYVPPPAPSPKDIVISELMADPSPVVGLPDAEFIELFNRSTKRVNLSGWRISDGSTAATLPAIDLLPGEYALVTALSNEAEFDGAGKTIGVVNFPSLNNAGDNIILTHSSGITIDSVHFTDAWYGDGKNTGGWTLELIDPENLCGEENNWTASVDERGGTPGHQNSVHASRPDLTPPAAISLTPLNPLVLQVVFNEKLSAAPPSLGSITIEPAAAVQAIRFADRSLRTLWVDLRAPLQARTLYVATISSVQDCSGNAVATQAIEFALPERADSLDVVINEILFNPRATGVDFVEIVNVSDKFINLKGWLLGHYEQHAATDAEPISENDRLLPPGGYIAIATDKNLLLSEYPQAPEKNVMVVKSLPSLPDEEGDVAIVSEQGSAIDHVRYNKNDHSPLIADAAGVSLERISFTAPSNDAQNWKSASSASGYATPGYRNSNTRPAPTLQADAIRISPEIFAPQETAGDFAAIHYLFDQGGYIANVKIFDPQGRLVKQVASNALLGTEGFLRWDGDRDDGSKARVGSYMVWFEVFNPQGDVQTYRGRVAIATRF